MADQPSSNLEFWTAVHDVLTSADKSLPWGDDPRTVGWDHPDELWKNDAELQHYEDELKDDIHLLIEKFCENREWPKRSKSGARFLLSRRLTWARDFVRILAIPSSRIGGAAVWRPESSGWDVIHWLLTEAYEDRYPPTPNFPMYYGGSFPNQTE